MPIGCPKIVTGNQTTIYTLTVHMNSSIDNYVIITKMNTNKIDKLNKSQQLQLIRCGCDFLICNS